MADGEDEAPAPPPQDEPPKGSPPWARSPGTPPPGFAGPRPPAPTPGMGVPPAPGAPPPGVAQPMPPTAERASTKAIATRSNRAVVFWVLAALVLIGAGVAFKVAASDEGKVSTSDAKPHNSAETTTAPVQDPEFHRFVRDYCTSQSKQLAAKATRYAPGSLAYTTVFYPQAIGAPGQRTGWFMLNISPKVGTPEQESSFSGVPSSRLQLAACMTNPTERSTGVNCTYDGDPALGEDQATVVELVQTTYDLTVYEVATGKVVASGQVATDGTTCPKDALVEMGDTVSAPMTPQVAAAWFSQHVKGGRFS